jgi:hypothetical protein
MPFQKVKSQQNPPSNPLKHTIVKTLILSLFFSASALAQGSFAIKNATLHLGNGKVIEQGLLHVHEGKIAAVVDAKSNGSYTLAPDIPVLDGQGWNVFPGLILMNTIVGLTEIDAVRATLDFDEVGRFTPEVEGHVAFNAASSILPTLRQNGVLFAEVCPRNGMIAGSSSVLRLDGKAWPQALLAKNRGMHMHWPRTNRESAELKKDLLSLLEQAKAGRTGQQYQALRRVILGDEPIMLHINSASEWQDAMDFFRPWPSIKLIVLECRDCELIAKELNSQNQPFIASRIWELPPYAHSDPSQRYASIRALDSAGLILALDYEGDMEAMGGRNLGFMAGTLQRAGFSPNEILPLITLNPAKILGIDDQVGSLEVGKEASFFACQGSPLEALHFKLLHLWSQGIEIPLEGRQESLKYEFESK